MTCNLRCTLTLWAVRHFSSGLLSSFHALLQFWPVGIRSLAHRHTGMSSSLGAAGRNSHKASASHSRRVRGSASHTRSKTYPSAKSMEPQGSPAALGCSRLGIMALRALTHTHLIQCCERLAKGLECCLISSPKFPIMCSRVH